MEGKEKFPLICEKKARAGGGERDTHHFLFYMSIIINLL